MIIGPYRVLLNMVTVEIVGSAMFVVVFTYGYRRQDCHYQCQNSAINCQSSVYGVQGHHPVRLHS